jgi:hypothetical protein
MPPSLSLDRLVRKEVALGVVREILPPQNHIGLSVVAPWLQVESDDVIFDYAKGLTDGLAPARAEDAESELAQKDYQYVGQGRAAVIDWALKDHYSASDVTRYREALLIAEQVRDTNSLQLTIKNMLEGWQQKLARDTFQRRRKLDNRIEWLIMNQALQAGTITYNDNKVKFLVDFQRPAGQHNQPPKKLSDGTTDALWSLVTSDPIGNILQMQQVMLDLYGIRMTRAITSRRVINAMLNSDKFAARSGLISSSVPSGGTAGTSVNPFYVMDGWGPQAALEVVQRATGVTFTEYDAVYRTRPIGSNTVTNNRFTSDDLIFFLPNEDDVAEFDNTEISFAKTLTSPHPMGMWQPGYYEWESETEDPWGYNVGTGVKAFPVFTHMELTYVMDVL